MNVQPKPAGRPDEIQRLAKLWGLTPKNEELARAYLTGDPADDELLKTAEQQVFSSFTYQTYMDIFELMEKKSAPEQTKILKLLWAIGRSSAVFAVVFEQRYWEIASDSIYRRWCEVLGPAAAAAMEAERAARDTRYGQTKRLHQVAKTSPEVLLEAEQLLADPQHSMADGVLAGILLANTTPAEKKPGLLGKLLGTASGARRVREGTLPERQVKLVLAWAAAAVRGCAGCSAGDIRMLNDYIDTGDPSLPVPAVSVPTAWQVPPEDIFIMPLINRRAAECIAASAMFGIPHDDRLTCAFRVIAGLDPYGALEGTLLSIPEDWPVSVLDQVVPHIPGGAATLLRFAPRKLDLALTQKLVFRYQAGLDEALRYVGTDEYAELCALMPAGKGRDTRREQMRGRIVAALEEIFDQGTQRTIVHDYLAGQGDFSDSAAILRPIRSEYRFFSNVRHILSTYRKMGGWDEFACRCVVLDCLTCTGYGASSLFSESVDEKGSITAFAAALTTCGLPVRDCMTVLAVIHENCYQESVKQYIQEIVETRFVTPEGLEALADAARNGSAFARTMAVKGLDALTARPECAQSGRQALIACAGDSSKQVQEVLETIYISHPDWEKDYLAMLKSKKGAQRGLAVRVLSGIGVEKYRSVLEEALAAEKSSKLIDQLSSLLGMGGSGTGEGASQAGSPAALAAQVLKGGKKRKVQWLLEQPLPPVRHTDGTPAEEDQIAALFVAYAELGRIGRSDTGAALAADLEPKDLETLACEVWELWMKGGAQSKTKWVLPFAAVFGGAAMTPRLIRAIHDWPQNARGAIACDAVTALTVSPDPAALLAVDSISRKFKFRQVKTAAAAALEHAAEELGITPDELADRIVPELGFASDGTRVFDYGTRRFTVRLTSTLELAVTTDAGKAVKNLPAPVKNDDPDRAAAAYDAYKTLKKQIKTTVSAQRARLESALSAQRCWNAQAWKKLFVANPIMHQFAISLIWGVYEGGVLKETFRYMEDGSFNIVDEEEYELPAEGSIGLVHPIELAEETLAAWRQQLEDYEIVQSIDQLSRPIYHLPPERVDGTALETAAGRKLNDLSLTGKLQGMGWYRGSVVDGGGFYTFYREDPAVGIGVELNFSGSFVGGENEEVTVYDAVFYKAGTVKRGSYCYDAPGKEDIFALGQVPARYYSEIVWQLERATASSTETDPDWRNKKN